MNDKVQKHLEDKLLEIRSIFEKAIMKVEAIKPGEKVPVTKLIGEVAQEIGANAPALYHVLRYLFKDYPIIIPKKGAKGGLFRPLYTEVNCPTLKGA